MSTESRASELLTALAADPALRDQLTHAPKDQRAAIIDDSSIDDEDLEVVTGGAGFAPILSVGAFIVY
jgi:hypothetical protein